MPEKGCKDYQILIFLRKVNPARTAIKIIAATNAPRGPNLVEAATINAIPIDITAKRAALPLIDTLPGPSKRAQNCSQR